MRINIDDELRTLGDWARSQGTSPEASRFIDGAVWMAALISGQDPANVLAAVLARPADTFTPPPLPTFATGGIVGAPSTPSASDDPAPLGVYGMLGPITKLAEELPPADLTKPPASPIPGAYSELSKQAAERGEVSHLPMDDETLAAVEAEIAEARSLVLGPAALTDELGDVSTP